MIDDYYVFDLHSLKISFASDTCLPDAKYFDIYIIHFSVPFSEIIVKDVCSLIYNKIISNMKRCISNFASLYHIYILYIALR